MTDAVTTEATPPVPAAEAPAPFDGQKPRTQKVGKVVSDKMDKTVVVAVEYVKRHPLYHKRMTRTSKFMAHDELNLCKPGDLVRIEETRPLSKRKRWVVREIVQQAVRI
jgi:small subunit ribosomal protein S17